MGQQILTLGLATTEGFVPIDNELFTSQSKAQEFDTQFKDGRSVAAKRFRVAHTQTKPEMAKSMITRAMRAGIDAMSLNSI